MSSTPAPQLLLRRLPINAQRPPVPTVTHAAPVNGGPQGLPSIQRMSATDILTLQRSVGNQRVLQMLRGQGGSATPVQRAATVGPAQDRYEREADHIAARVAPTRRSGENHLSRTVQEPPTVGAEGGALDSTLASRIRSSQSSGRPMPDGVRRTLEPHLGADLSSVRVHTDANAAYLNQQLGAKAFTSHNHIFYGAGQSPSDLRLTAHESVHTVQQGGARQHYTLQRATGQQITHSRPAVQRYMDNDLDDTEVDLPSKKTQKSQGMFTRHLTDPVFKSFGEGMDFDFKNVANPGLRASDDKTVVIQSNPSVEPQEFYATDAVVNNARNVLTGHDSRVELVTPGPTLDVAKGGGKSTLKQVKAKLRRPDLNGPGGIEQFLTHVCIEYANMVMGLRTQEGSHSLISEGQTKNSKSKKTKEITTGSVDSKQVGQMAKQMVSTSKKANGKTMFQGITDDAPSEDTAQQYGTQLGEGKLEKKAKRLGVNQYATPEVGEAYATYSILTSETNDFQGNKKKDYTQMVLGNPKLRDFAWGYHYAAVVAESEDKKDKITLENYNRKSDIVDTYIKKMIDNFHDITLEEINQAKTGGSLSQPNAINSLTQVYTAVATRAGRVAEEAKAEIEKGLKASFTQALQAWYFKMYGTEGGKGQTFHEKNVQSGFYANPLTVRVGAKGGTSYSNTKGMYQTAVNTVPLDYEPARPMNASYAVRQEAGEKITNATDGTQAQAIFPEVMRKLKKNQKDVHIKYAADLAQANGGDVVKRKSYKDSKVLGALLDMKRGCEAKQSRLSETWNPKRRGRLGTAATEIQNAHDTLQKILAHYAKYVPMT